ncbi:CRISPR-associated endonuclease Cas2 [uncultured Campylobacter sp.]|uniref:CRISPR-associated endonuclease Cas2 n=1 Tax=uncultured Campylobacter sp. TaxID=218934 RepID=UPI0026080448|nr:CRISPR-associated endonuclease Cas2 [uncultured Campylobacter sp.]
MNLIICYDVCKTKRRNKLAALLEGYGLRANYSVFELDVSERIYAELKQRIARIIEPKTDKVLFYRICKTCMAKSESLGEGDIFHSPDTYV